MNEEAVREGKFKALMLLQLIGIALGWILFTAAGAAYVLPGASEIKRVFLYAGILSFVVCVTNSPGLKAIRACWNGLVACRNWLPGVAWKCLPELKDASWGVSLDWGLRIFAFIDTIGLGCCILYTGGEVSIFAPFLFAIPTLVVLIEICLIREVLFWWALAWATFSTALQHSGNPLLFPGSGFTVRDWDRHHQMLILVTGICTLFPFLFIKSSRIGIRCAACSGTGRIPA
jgi:hypothetical protein